VFDYHRENASIIGAFIRADNAGVDNPQISTPLIPLEP
jgi:hypothetical protein